MARGRKAQSSPREKTPEAESLAAKIVLHPSEDTPQYYINYAEVACSQNEFSIYGVTILTKLPPDEVKAIKKSKELHLEPAVQIIIPVTVIQGLIDALIKQRDFYAAEFGTTIPMEAGERK